MDDEEEDGIVIHNGAEKETFSVREANSSKEVQEKFQLDYRPTFVLSKKSKKRVDFGRLEEGKHYRLPAISIWNGEQKEIFFQTEANNAKEVQDRFRLEYEPEFLLTKKDNKRVEFGRLEDGKIYTIPARSEMKLKIHTQNAVILSQAVYKYHPIDFLNECSTQHSVKSIKGITKYSKQKLMVAVGVVENENVLYVVYRGSDSRDDFMADINIRLKQIDDIPGGKLHAGFEERSKTLPIEYILECAKKESCRMILTTGHSLGGAVSSIVALDLLKSVGSQGDVSVFNITFGAPFFGNEAIRKLCKEKKLLEKFLHYVDYRDIVPGLLSLGHTANILRSETVQVTDGFKQCLIDKALKYQEISARVGKFLLQNVPDVPIVQTKFTDEEVGILSGLASDVMSGFKETKLGEEYTNEMFVPIGSYCVLENGATSVLDHDSISPQVQELVLKEPFRNVTSLHSIKEGHGIAKYRENLTSSTNLSLAPRLMVHELFFKPSVEGKASIVWTANGDGSWRCQLAVRGHFLQSLQMESSNNDFSPFESASKCNNVSDGENEALYISQKTQKLVEIVPPGETVQLKLATAFGILLLPVSEKEIRHSSLDFDCENISVEEQVAIILNQSVARSLAISDMVSGEAQHDDELKQLIDNEVNRLDTKYQDKYNELFTCLSNNPLDDSRKITEKISDISEITKKIIDNITQKIKLYHNDLEKLKEFKKNVARIARGPSGEFEEIGFWGNIGLFFSWFFGSGEEIEADYVEQLQTVIAEIRVNVILPGDEEKEDLLSALALWGPNAFFLERLLISYEKDRYQLKETEVVCRKLWYNVFNELREMNKKQLDCFLDKEFSNSEEFCKEVDHQLNSITEDKEKKNVFDGATFEVKEMLFSTTVLKSLKKKVRGKAKEFPRKSDNVFAHLTEESQEAVEKKIKMFKNVHEIRQLYGKQCYIGFIGPQNAGKSTLINTLWGKKAKTGMRTHTKQPTRYRIAKEVFAVDFPGANSLDDQLTAMLKNTGHMNNFLVYVIQYNGSPDEQLIANIKLAYKLRKISGKSSKTLFCLNKACLYQSDDDDDDDDDNTSWKDYKKDYVQIIREHIKNHPYDEKEDTLWRNEIAGNKAYKEIEQKNEELRQYTLTELRDEDFIFTDWKDKDATEGIKGPEEVRKRIRDFLVKSKILTSTQTVDLI